MNRWSLLIALMACSAIGLAQQPEPGEGDAARAGTSAEAAESPAWDTQADTEKATTADTGQEDASKANEKAADEEAADDEAAKADEEFIPSEEISEDYAAPLPSDI